MEREPERTWESLNKRDFEKESLREIECERELERELEREHHRESLSELKGKQHPNLLHNDLLGALSCKYRSLHGQRPRPLRDVCPDNA